LKKYGVAGAWLTSNQTSSTVSVESGSLNTVAARSGFGAFDTLAPPRGEFGLSADSRPSRE
jgi:hypothetical protein